MNTYINHRWVSLGPAHLHLSGNCWGMSSDWWVLVYCYRDWDFTGKKSCMHLGTRQKVNQKKFPLGGGETLYKYVIGG